VTDVGGREETSNQDVGERHARYTEQTCPKARTCRHESDASYISWQWTRAAYVVYNIECYDLARRHEMTDT